MSRVKLNYQQLSVQTQPDLVSELKRGLNSTDQAGQPLVYEYDLRDRLLRVLVVWDKWQSLFLESRTAVILAAYHDQPDQEVALASGLTMPEAAMAGFLPFRIIAALRRNDRFTQQECWRVMVEMGASELFEDEPRLYFATRTEAEKTIAELSRQLPGSEEIWQIIRDVGGIAQDDPELC
ncbi:MAG: hypothetical protein ACO3NK_01480 [Prochlorotrichaceae cyanobacterium]|jgi:hypothetical protein